MLRVVEMANDGYTGVQGRRCGQIAIGDTLGENPEPQ